MMVFERGSLGSSLSIAAWDFDGLAVIISCPLRSIMMVYFEFLMSSPVQGIQTGACWLNYRQKSNNYQIFLLYFVLFQPFATTPKDAKKHSVYLSRKEPDKFPGLPFAHPIASFYPTLKENRS
jgi:hypothetical protein